VTENIEQWHKEYRFNPATGDFEHVNLEVDFPSLNDFSPLTTISSIISDQDKTLLQRIFS